MKDKAIEGITAKAAKEEVSAAFNAGRAPTFGRRLYEAKTEPTIKSILFKGNLKEGDYKLIKTTNGWVLEGADIAYCGIEQIELTTEDPSIVAPNCHNCANEGDHDGECRCCVSALQENGRHGTPSHYKPKKTDCPWK